MNIRVDLKTATYRNGYGGNYGTYNRQRCPRRYGYGMGTSGYRTYGDNGYRSQGYGNNGSRSPYGNNGSNTYRGDTGYACPRMGGVGRMPYGGVETGLGPASASTVSRNRFATTTAAGLGAGALVVTAYRVRRRRVRSRG